MIARIGGCEFAFLLADANPQSCASQIESIVQSIRRTCNDLNLNLDLGVSTGAAFFPADGATTEAVLAAASRRMHLHQRSLQKASPKSARLRSLELAASA